MYDNYNKDDWEEAKKKLFEQIDSIPEKENINNRLENLIPIMKSLNCPNKSCDLIDNFKTNFSKALNKNQ